MSESKSRYPDRRERVVTDSSGDGSIQEPKNPKIPSQGDSSSEESSKNHLEKTSHVQESPEIQKTNGAEPTGHAVSGFMDFSGAESVVQEIDKLIDGLSVKENQADEQPNASAFPVDDLPPEAQGMVEEFRLQTQGQINPALPGVFSLAAISAATIPRLETELPDGRRDSSNLYTLVGASSSSGKTMVVSRIFAPLTNRDRELADIHLETVKPNLEVEEELLREELDRLKKERKKNKNTESCPQENRARFAEIKKRLARILIEKVCPRFWIQDTSETAIVKALDCQKKKVLTLKDCDARKTIRTMCSGITSSGHSEEDKLIKGWDQEDIILDRSMGGDGHGGGFQAHIRKPTISMALAVQPDKIEELSRTKELFDSGLFQRILIANADSEPLLEQEHIHKSCDAKRRWEDLIYSLLDSFRCHESDSEDDEEREGHDAVIVRPSREANQTWIYFQNRIARFQRESLRGAKSIALKWAQNNNRIALNLHAAKHRENAGDHEISLDTMMRAIRITCWFARQQLEIFNPVRTTIEEKNKERLVKALGDKDRYGDATATVAVLENRHGINRDDALEAAKSYPGLFQVTEPIREPGKAGRTSTPKIKMIKPKKGGGR